jgi:hypothetical protein
MCMNPKPCVATAAAFGMYEKQAWLGYVMSFVEIQHNSYTLK